MLNKFNAPIPRSTPPTEMALAVFLLVAILEAMKPPTNEPTEYPIIIIKGREEMYAFTSSGVLKFIAAGGGLRINPIFPITSITKKLEISPTTTDNILRIIRI